MKTYLNLLPVSFRRARLVRRRLLQWSLVWAVAATICAGMWNVRRDRLVAAQQALEQRQKEFAPLAKLVASSATIRGRINELSQRETMAGQLHDERPPLSAIGLVSRGAAQCDGRVQVQRLLIEREAAGAGGKAAAVGNARKPSVLTIEGTGLDDLAVARFVVALREAKTFDAVELKSTTRSPARAGEVSQFTVVCTF